MTSTKGYTLLDASAVTVKQLSDLPAPSGGVITLADSTIYTISGAVSIGTNTITMGNDTTIRSNSRLVNSLTYTGSGTMFTATNKSFRIDDTTIGCTSGTMFAISGTGAETVSLYRLATDGCKTLGTVSGLHEFRIALVCHFMNGSTGGFTFSGTFDHLIIANSMAENNAGTLFDFGTATIDHVQVVADHLVANGGQTIFAGTPTIGVVFQAVSNEFAGAGTYTSGSIDPNTPGYLFYANSGVVSTSAVGEVSFQGNASATTITVAGTFYKAAGTTTAGTNHLFTTATTNRLTYSGVLTRTFLVDASCAVSTGNNNQTLAIILAKNGATISSTEVEIRQQTASVSADGTTKGIVTLSTGDYLEVFVTNKTNTNATTIEYMNFTASAIN